jgi:hypothetical protein
VLNKKREIKKGGLFLICTIMSIDSNCEFACVHDREEAITGRVFPLSFRSYIQGFKSMGFSLRVCSYDREEATTERVFPVT